MLHNGVGVWGGGVSDFPEKSVTKVDGSTLLPYKGVGGCQISRKKRYVKLEWPDP